MSRVWVDTSEPGTGVDSNYEQKFKEISETEYWTEIQHYVFLNCGLIQKAFHENQ